MKTNFFRSGLSTPVTVLFILIVVAAVGGIYYALAPRTAVAPENGGTLSGEKPGETLKHALTIPLTAQNNSGESGTAVFEDRGTETHVTIFLEGVPAGVVKPAHIHLGSCPNPGAVKYPLADIVRGKSETTISAPLWEILSTLPLAVTVQKSTTEATVYVSCGDIKTADGIVGDSRDMMKNAGGSKPPGGSDTGMQGGGDPRMSESGMMAPQTRTFDIRAENFSFSHKTIRVKKGDTIRINLAVTEGFHDWVVDEFNARTEQISAGKTTSVEFVASRAGTFEYYCSVGTHRQMGMTGKLIVE